MSCSVVVDSNCSIIAIEIILNKNQKIYSTLKVQKRVQNTFERLDPQITT